MKEILQIGEDVLRKKATRVVISDISSKKIQKILKEMQEALSNEKDGVAIAAPQIGYSKRIFIVANRVFQDENGMEEKESNKIYINSKIIKTSRNKSLVDEGCLSVRWKYGKVERANKVTIEAYDAQGKKFQRGASGLLAQIFQHETDHLDGIFFVDKAVDLAEYYPDPEDLKNSNNVDSNNVD